MVEFWSIRLLGTIKYAAVSVRSPRIQIHLDAIGKMFLNATLVGTPSILEEEEDLLRLS